MPRQTSRTFAVTGILIGMGVLATGWSMVNMALSSIQMELGASVEQLQWMMNVYGIFICIPLLTFGKLGDSQGRKKIYIAGLAGLGLACLGAGFAESPAWIIGCMAIFGISGASVLPLSQALVVHQFPEKQKSKAVALWATFTSLALAMGPLFGGVILRYASWRWIFFIEVAFSLSALSLVSLFANKEEKHDVHCDWGGVGLLAATIGATVTAIMQGPNWGWSSMKVILLFALAFLALAVFIFVEKKSKNPLFRTDLFSNPNFLFSSICNGCLCGFIWSVFFFIPLYLQNEKGASPLQTGFTMLLITLPVAIFSVGVNRLYEKIGSKLLLVGGFFLLLLSALSQAIIPIEASCLLIGFGWVMTWGPSTSGALTSLPHRMAGIASGMFMTLQEIGGVLGLSLAGVIFRMGTSRFLAPRMDEIHLGLEGQESSLISDPLAAENILGGNSEIIDWLHEGFMTGFGDMLWFLVLLSGIGIAVALLLPRKAT